MNPPPVSSSTRRQFLVTGAAMAAIAAVPSLRAAAEKSAPAAARRPLKKGIMWGTLRDLPGSVAEKMRIIADAGFDGVEMMSHMDVDEVLRARDATGLTIPSVCGSLHWAKSLTDPNPAVREEGSEALRHTLRDAHRYGASSVLLVPGVVKADVPYDVAYERSQAEIRKVIPLARELGVKIAIENVPNAFLLTPLEAARYVDELGTADVGWHFDIGNSILYGWPEHWLRILGPRTLKLHIKEISRKKYREGGFKAAMEVEFFEGDNNWPVVMKAIDQIGYQGWAIAEPAWKPPGVDPAVRLHELSKIMDRIIAV